MELPWNSKGFRGLCCGARCGADGCFAETQVITGSVLWFFVWNRYGYLCFSCNCSVGLVMWRLGNDFFAELQSTSSGSEPSGSEHCGCVWEMVQFQSCKWHFALGYCIFSLRPADQFLSQDKSHGKLDKFPMALHSPSNLWVEMAVRPKYNLRI